MNDSILESIRKLIGGAEIPSGEEGPFDLDLIFHINTALGILNQLGIGKEGFSIEDATATWSDFLSEQEAEKGITLNEVKTYVLVRVRLFFDTPQSSVLVQQLKEQYDELGWRLTTKVETAVV